MCVRGYCFVFELYVFYLKLNYPIVDGRQTHLSHGDLDGDFCIPFPQVGRYAATNVIWKQAQGPQSTDLHPVTHAAGAYHRPAQRGGNAAQSWKAPAVESFQALSLALV